MDQGAPQDRVAQEEEEEVSVRDQGGSQGYEVQGGREEAEDEGEEG
jgi:hypothetical protein